MELSEIVVGERFTRFIEGFLGDGNPSVKYEAKIAAMAADGTKSVVIAFNDMYSSDEPLAQLVLEKPRDTLKQMGVAALSKLRMRDPEYADLLTEVSVRISGLPTEASLRDIGQPEQIGKLLMITGFITQISSPSPYLIDGTWECAQCTEPIFIEQKDQFQRPPTKCPTCGNRRGFTLMPEESNWVLSQRMIVQESPEALSSGQMPRPFKLILKGDLVESIHAGDLVSVTGVLNFIRRIKGGGTLRSYGLELEVNHIGVKSRYMGLVEITKEDRKRIEELAANPNIYQMITDSIAPSLKDLPIIKKAVAHYLFGGVSRDLPDVYLRGWINILLLGDPGTAKTQLCIFASRVAPRAMLTGGGGHASGVGLTASVVKGDSGEYVLKAGALTLCDEGHCIIDELDKIKTEHRQALHTPMEQGQIFVNKGGFNSILNARTGILASANPVLGRYNAYQTMSENINIPVTLLSRFDLIFILKDIPEKEKDTGIAGQIIQLRRGINPQEPPIEQELLTKYLIIARQLDPILSEELTPKLTEMYVNIRSAAYKQGGATPISITPRMLEAVVRLAEGGARMHLREKVTEEDLNAAIELMIASLDQVGIDHETGEYDVDIIYTGKPRGLQMQLQTVLGMVGKMERIEGAVRDDDLYEALSSDANLKRSEAARLIGVLMRDGTIYAPRPGYYKKTA